jgi:hypothetical protein
LAGGTEPFIAEKTPAATSVDYARSYPRYGNNVA